MVLGVMFGAGLAAAAESPGGKLTGKITLSIPNIRS
jgi:hypothetical protein